MVIFAQLAFWNEKSIWRCHLFSNVYQKSLSYDVCFLRYGCDRQFFVILGHSLTLLTTKKVKTFKKWKIFLKISFYTCVPQMTTVPYDVWFLKYGVWKTEFLVILDYFLPIYLPNNSENQTFEKKGKKVWRYHFTQVHHK